MRLCDINTRRKEALEVACVGAGHLWGLGGSYNVVGNVFCVKSEGKTIDLEEHEKCSVSHTQQGRKLYNAGESLLSPAELRGWWGIPSTVFPPSDEI